MKIKSIRLHLVECQMPEALGAGGQFFDRRSSLLAEVQGDEGVSGWGETWHSPSAAWTIIETTLAPVILGQDPFEYQRLWADMHERLGYERQGPGLMALSAVDMALWDLRGRALGQPIARLLGGPLRTRVPAYASGPYLRPGRDPYRRYRQEAERIVAAGFRALKMKVGVDPASDGRAATAVRKVVGPDVILLADANQVYTTRPAMEAGRQLEHEGFAWLEEPVGPDNVEAYASLAGALGLAVVGGEALGGIRAFRAFFERHALDVAQPDVSIAGGFTEVTRIEALAGRMGRSSHSPRLGDRDQFPCFPPAVRSGSRIPKPHILTVPVVRVRSVAQSLAGSVGCARDRSGWHGGSPAGPGAGDRSGPARIPTLPSAVRRGDA